MSDPTTFSMAARRDVARLLATCFLVHLEAEAAKPDAVLLEDYPELPVREMTRTWIDLVRREFEIDAKEAPPTGNIFKRWCDINGKFDYEDSGLFGYNRVYLPRLLDLRDGTAESQERFFSAMRNTFDGFDYEKQGFTVAFFLNSESNMRELMREVVRKNLPDPGREADKLVLSQSAAFQTVMYEYFEGILKTALAENVRLLNGILPQQVATELKRNGFVKPVYFNDAAVIFTDFENFSRLTEHLAPAEVIRRLDAYFTEFDRIIAAHGLEKIKTIGDSYMAVAGVPELHRAPVRAACDAALEITEASRRISALAGPDEWNIRIGIHAGPLVAGVIGKQKFSYDVWGATVNFASRMESSGAPGRTNVSVEVHSRVEPHYLWEARGPQPVKHLGTAEMFFLLGKKP
ncbi:MAG TPA: adenylate/guanylate cyclase domain-containing protein [Candidatus Methylacidiphilales bacterium]|jgi:class 3 adenylate cyclase|nr:adenylate/guanylate cyclase domain-containing protein [Candidatus Methylacidiphilales bacterium]